MYIFFNFRVGSKIKHEFKMIQYHCNPYVVNNLQMFLMLVSIVFADY